ncbi:DUF748 domain-containing protein [Alteromonas sp. C1M14]|uniref:DUF748 domain-containing protein n=1 Tax=Alteromonas sp. C1M14 TaxID=2841567 RepID=UPI001C0884DA|nr:DUF748 domain-containing protein [Alteromonas sp. C1M14]MBU2978341.1 DUF748 domain-containing protein [Alteromonas sp. C1M14]
MAKHHGKKPVTYFVLVVASIVLLRMSLPFAAQWYINDTLDKGENFTGSVGDVDILLWRGAYQLENIVILKRTGEVTEPFLEIEQADISLLWSALFDKAVVADVNLVHPQVNFVDGPSKKSSQSGENENWLNLADQLVPLRVDRLHIEHGTVRFINPTSSPAIKVKLHQIDATARNLVNSRHLSKDLIATIEGTGKTEDKGTITLTASLDPSTPKPTFDINLQANDVALGNFKPLLETYAPFDLEAGTLEFTMELASDNGSINGYAKPILHQVEVFSWKGDIEDDDDGFFRGISEGMSAFIAELFENQSEDQIATRIPLSGSLSDVNTPVFSTLVGILRNAFIQAIRGDLENSVVFSETEPNDEQQADPQQP